MVPGIGKMYSSLGSSLLVSLLWGTASYEERNDRDVIQMCIHWSRKNRSSNSYLCKVADIARRISCDHDPVDKWWCRRVGSTECRWWVTNAAVDDRLLDDVGDKGDEANEGPVVVVDGTMVGNIIILSELDRGRLNANMATLEECAIDDDDEDGALFAIIIITSCSSSLLWLASICICQSSSSILCVRMIMPVVLDLYMSEKSCTPSRGVSSNRLFHAFGSFECWKWKVVVNSQQERVVQKVERKERGRRWLALGTIFYNSARKRTVLGHSSSCSLQHPRTHTALSIPLLVMGLNYEVELYVDMLCKRWTA